MKLLLTNFKPQLPFTAIMSKEQTQGRGQRGTNWHAKPNENITVSFFNSAKNLLVDEQFVLTITTSLAIYNILSRHLNTDIHIKWPNDIIVNNKKIAGVLIENKIGANHIKQSIIGIGINVYSTDFPIEIAHKTTSIILENFEFNMTLIDLVREIRQELIRLDQSRLDGNIDELWYQYTQSLFRKNIQANYQIDNQIVKGIIIGVNRNGRLIIEIDNEVKICDLKDISYQL